MYDSISLRISSSHDVLIAAGSALLVSTNMGPISLSDCNFTSNIASSMPVLRFSDGI